MNQPAKEITIIIVTWNSRNFLPELFDSIQNQTSRVFDTIIVDNGSTDSTCSWLEKNHPEVKLIKNKKNTGFSKAYNAGIQFSQTPYVLVCNHDIILDPNFLSELLKVAKTDQKIGSLGGKLLRWQSLNKKDDFATIDSTGIVFLKTRRAIDRGESERDEGRYNKQEEIFGISGALALYQKAALEQIAINGEYFDEDFFAYKEDLDLAWRLKAQGFKSIYVPTARAYHKRETSRKTDLSDKGTMINRQTKTSWANYLSYRNHLFLLIKNETVDNLFFNHNVWWYEFKKIVYLLFKEPATLKAWKDIFQKLPKMLQKRKEIKKKKNISNKELYHWFQ